MIKSLGLSIPSCSVGLVENMFSTQGQWFTASIVESVPKLQVLKKVPGVQEATACHGTAVTNVETAIPEGLMPGSAANVKGKSGTPQVGVFGERLPYKHLCATYMSRVSVDHKKLYFTWSTLLEMKVELQEGKVRSQWKATAYAVPAG